MSWLAACLAVASCGTEDQRGTDAAVAEDAGPMPAVRRFVAMDWRAGFIDPTWTVVSLDAEGFTAGPPRRLAVGGYCRSTGDRFILTRSGGSYGDPVFVVSIDPDSDAPERVYDLSDVLHAATDALCGAGDLLLLVAWDSRDPNMVWLDLATGDARPVDTTSLGTRRVTDCIVREGLVYLFAGSTLYVCPLDEVAAPSTENLQQFALGSFQSVEMTGRGDLVLNRGYDVARVDLDAGGRVIPLVPNDYGNTHWLVSVGDHSVLRVSANGGDVDVVLDVIDVDEASVGPPVYEDLWAPWIDDAGWGQVILSPAHTNGADLGLLDIGTGVMLVESDLPVGICGRVPER